MSHEKDLDLQKLFKKCNASLVYQFCKLLNIDTDIYEDGTGIRFFLYYKPDSWQEDRIYCTPDNGFTYYITYTICKEKLIRDFTKFKGLKVFL